MNKVRINKNDTKIAETISITVLLCRYKCSSRRSISEAALHFGYLCVYEPSTLQKKPSASLKKPSNLQCSCAVNTFQKNVLNVGVIF